MRSTAAVLRTITVNCLHQVQSLTTNIPVTQQLLGDGSNGKQWRKDPSLNKNANEATSQ